MSFLDGSMTAATEQGLDVQASQLRVLAAGQANVWKGSPYFDEAEKWTHLFWDPDGYFRRRFDTLDMTYVIELACGHGRHAAALAAEKQAGMYVGLDVLPENVMWCQTRLNQHPNFVFAAVDGISFTPVNDGEASAIFCYDAMVHFDSQVVLSYLHDACRILRSRGRALFHHSNFYSNPASSYAQNPHARSFMSLDLFHHYAVRAGLFVIEAMPLRWAEYSNLDGLTLLEKP
jgi:SAM-dependent methyltransferase